MTLLHQIERYWTRRADSYSAMIAPALDQETEETWMTVLLPRLPAGKPLQILDIGTGPGFFAIALTRRGHTVTAVDYTVAMLKKAQENAGDLASRIAFRRMDAHHLEFPDDSFDAIVTRNLTWNLERPFEAYCEWRRVLKPRGVLLNFDAGWYNYLFDPERNAAFQRDRANVEKQQLFDFNSYDESPLMEEISRQLVFSRVPRPEADIVMLHKAGYSSIEVDPEVWKKTWTDLEQINFASTPLFCIAACK